MCPAVPADFTFDLPAGLTNAYPPHEYCPGSFNLEFNFILGDHSSVGTYYESDVKGHGLIMMRQPEQRLLSAWYDGHHGWPSWYFGRDAKNVLEFAHVLSGCAVRTLVRDIKSLGFDESPEACGNPESVTAAEVSIAKTRLREGFIFVGLTEEWDLSVCLLHAMMGGDCVATDFLDTHPTFNKTADDGYNTSELMGFTDEADGALYKDAVAMFEQQTKHYSVSQEGCQPCFSQAMTSR